MTDGVHFLDACGPDGTRLYAIGDVHGCIDQLDGMFGLIDAEIARDGVEDWRIILLGDYCDRGPDVRGVLDLIVSRQAADPRVIALAGNHDDGFLQFLDEPRGESLFFRYGGMATARSYGVTLDEHDLRTSRDRLLAAVPEHHLGFLRTLLLSAEFGDFFFCHAGIRPEVPLREQRREDLTWIRDTFLGWPKLHPRVIVHGHTPAAAAEIMANRVNVDTGAVYGGTLTALVVDGADKRLIHA
ncbi:MAG: serine/threonine protein phosphatase [Brucellaceae bacterium]|nr:serine/threonine protein phosphatase [Brucellaceae bacterium]